jgi:UDP-4-amino-4,6-dideoxy-N-acetyl-beta-L-altrosamine N-acetyltransferase
MQIAAYGIVLKAIEAADLELVRRWRNAEHVKKHMHYQDHITEAMQQRWFDTIDKTCNVYFVIEKESEKLGVVNLKDIDWNSKTAEAGIFIGEEHYLNTPVPVLATIAIMEYAFESLRLKSLKAKIASPNLKAVLFNESIGYQKQEEQACEGFDYYITDERSFREATKTIRKTLDKLK